MADEGREEEEVLGFLAVALFAREEDFDSFRFCNEAFQGISVMAIQRE